jgi:uncharacterized membrane protein HdeD (DUF308 family)
MEQPQNSNIAQTHSSPTETRPRTSIIVIIIAWIMLLVGILVLLLALPSFLLADIVTGIITLVQGVGLIAVSFGIRRMRRWALYTFTALTVLAIGEGLYALTNSLVSSTDELAAIGIFVLVLGYFWVISKRFT